MDYAFEHKGKAFTPDGVKPIADIETHNKTLEANELAHWETKPSAWQVYITEKDGRRLAATWLGTRLGDVVEHRSFRTNVSRNMVSVRIRATNGAVYYGRYGADWSQLCRVRKVKTDD